MGQWSRGGGIMIGDMFNHSLKAKVEQLCSALAEHVDEKGGSDDALGAGDWWPRDLGRPSAVGSQNEEAYACFPDKRRLAIRDVDGVRVYDTGDHRISGVSQQQGGGRDLTFASQHGTVRQSDLEPVGERALSREPKSASDARTGTASSPAVGPGADVLSLLERLHDLHGKGILTEEEFSGKKAELLARL